MRAGHEGEGRHCTSGMPAVSSADLSEHGLPSCLIPIDCQAIPGTYERQPEQIGLTFDSGKKFGIRKLQVSESSVDPVFPISIDQFGQSKALSKSPDFCGRHRPLREIDEVDGRAALLEESLRCTRCMRVPESKNLDSHHTRPFSQTGSAVSACRSERAALLPIPAAESAAQAAQPGRGAPVRFLIS